MKIYDCFNFYNEFDILEIRLNILNEHVDHFVLVECDVTHTGISKSFNFEENKERFSKFLDKIIHIKVIDTPNDFINLPPSNDLIVNEIYHHIEKQTKRFDRKTQPDYGRDFYQKECVKKGLINCNDDDIILFSDVDEIPHPKFFNKIDKLDFKQNIYSLHQPTYYYYLNVFKQNDWFGTKATSYKNIKGVSLNELRNEPHHSIVITNCGWHFSFMGGEEAVKNKLLAYSAREMAHENVLNNIENNMKNNIDPFFRSKLSVVEIDGSYPTYILENLEKYKHLIK